MWKLWKNGEGEGVSKADLRAVSERLDAVEAAVKAVELEWTSTLQKIRRIAGHITKANAIDERAMAPPVTARQRTAEDLTVEEILALQIPFSVQKEPH